jgi:hypothetical protein
LLAGHENHVPADHLAKEAFGKELLGKFIQSVDLSVVFGGEFINGQESLFGIEAEVPIIVVGEIPGIHLIADDEELDKGQEGVAVPVAGLSLVVDDLLHGPARTDGEGLEFDLYHRHAIDEQDDIVAVVAGMGIDAQLIDHFVVILAPIANIDQHIVEGGTIVALEGVQRTQALGGNKNIGTGNLVEQAGKLAIGQPDAV